MTEKILQYIWNYKIFIFFDFKDIDGNPIEIINSGTLNTNSGPDFLLAKIKTKDLVLIGNIELHIKSSDWNAHKHSENDLYDNIILHVVLSNDVKIDEHSEKNISTLELKNYIDPTFLKNIENLDKKEQFIPCEDIFDESKIPPLFVEETILNKLEKKSLQIQESLTQYKNNFEAVLFHQLAYGFGLKINSDIFMQMAESLDFSIIQKIQQNETQLEALFFGKSGWLRVPTDDQMMIWEKEYQFLVSKFNLSPQYITPRFLRLRPPNFPTIRLSQFANLYHQHQNLFSKIISCEKHEDLYTIFKSVKASKYWDSHYNFDSPTLSDYQKNVTKEFINLLIANVVLPLQYTYFKDKKEDITDYILQFYRDIEAEKNTIIDGWKNLGVKINNALESQAFIYHHKTFCSEKNCLNCSIGYRLLKNK